MCGTIYTYAETQMHTERDFYFSPSQKIKEEKETIFSIFLSFQE